MQMIGHQKKQRDNPAHLGFIELCGIENCPPQDGFAVANVRERRICSRPLFFLAIEGHADVKQRAWFNPVRHSVVQPPREPSINFHSYELTGEARCPSKYCTCGDCFDIVLEKPIHLSLSARRWNALSSTRC